MMPPPSLARLATMRGIRCLPPSAISSSVLPASTATATNARCFSAGDEKMSRADLVQVVAEAHEISKAEADRILGTVLDTIVDSVSEKKKVSLGGFGSFESCHTKERTARNPSTGEPVHVPAKERVKFTAYTAFKNSVNGK